MMTLPSRSRMCALISPTCSSTSDSIDCSPERIRARVSRTQVGQSESVVRGQPSCGDVRSWLFSSGAGGPLRLERPGVEPPVDRLEHRPREPGPAPSAPVRPVSTHSSTGSRQCIDHSAHDGEARCDRNQRRRARRRSVFAARGQRDRVEKDDAPRDLVTAPAAPRSNCRTSSARHARARSATMHATICWPRRASAAATTRDVARRRACRAAPARLRPAAPCGRRR